MSAALCDEPCLYLCMRFLRDMPHQDMFYQTRCPKYRRLLCDHLLQVVTLSPHPGRDGEYVVTPGSPWAPKEQGGEA
ncbi:hypothetical protein [Akkermansia glycaniphila]|uniref:Uncharacterized protein n=1 Tax=Akkermansia glycaniphila TaxID=1679444 RepID=A0A1H6LFI5_9BACT|nr:hypothetical protein [Akkermansia glycaniphila]SEH87281.1 Hypothetical protein PYTT_1359 [Akkermansia glycaniphila]